jgi:beta-galactosidase
VRKRQAGDALGSEKSEPPTLDLDLGEVATVNRVLINWEAAYATKYELQIATNAAGPFTTIYTDSAGSGGTDDVTTLTARDGRYLRMNGITRRTVYGFSIYEIAVYGDKDETCQ